jgi:hypothetical protein
MIILSLFVHCYYFTSLYAPCPLLCKLSIYQRPCSLSSLLTLVLLLLYGTNIMGLTWLARALDLGTWDFAVAWCSSRGGVCQR